MPRTWISTSTTRKVDALTDVPFKTISAYLSIPAGAHNVKVVPTGGAVADAVIDADVTFASGERYTVAATNAVATIEAQVITDAPAPTADGAQLRVVHLSADTPAVDVRPDGGDPIVTALAYPDGDGVPRHPGGDIRPRGLRHRDGHLPARPRPGHGRRRHLVFGLRGRVPRRRTRSRRSSPSMPRPLRPLRPLTRSVAPRPPRRAWRGRPSSRSRHSPPSPSSAGSGGSLGGPSARPAPLVPRPVDEGRPASPCPDRPISRVRGSARGPTGGRSSRTSPARPAPR